jgi:hypothetical protein
MRNDQSRAPAGRHVMQKSAVSAGAAASMLADSLMSKLAHVYIVIFRDDANAAADRIGAQHIAMPLKHSAAATLARNRGVFPAPANL